MSGIHWHSCDSIIGINLSAFVFWKQRLFKFLCVCEGRRQHTASPSSHYLRTYKVFMLQQELTPAQNRITGSTLGDNKSQYSKVFIGNLISLTFQTSNIVLQKNNSHKSHSQNRDFWFTNDQKGIQHKAINNTLFFQVSLHCSYMSIKPNVVCIPSF